MSPLRQYIIVIDDKNALLHFLIQAQPDREARASRTVRAGLRAQGLGTGRRRRPHYIVRAAPPAEEGNKGVT